MGRRMRGVTNAAMGDRRMVSLEHKAACGRVGMGRAVDVAGRVCPFQRQLSTLANMALGTAGTFRACHRTTTLGRTFQHMVRDVPTCSYPSTGTWWHSPAGPVLPPPTAHCCPHHWHFLLHLTVGSWRDVSSPLLPTYLNHQPRGHSPPSLRRAGLRLPTPPCAATLRSR